MGNTFFLLLAYLINFILIGLVVFLIYRIKILERKLLTFSPTEAYAIMENMKELTVETQIIADKLDASIRERESVLEDLSDLVDNKISEFKKINISNNSSSISNNSKIEEKYISSEEYLNSQNKTSNYTKESNQDTSQLKTSQNLLNNAATININKNNSSKELSDIKSKIFELHMEGKNEIEIAKELGISTTEAKLAISLFK